RRSIVSGFRLGGRNDGLVVFPSVIVAYTAIRSIQSPGFRLGGRNDELVAGLLADSLISDQDAKAFAAAHAVYGKIPLVDGGNCRHARALREGDESGIGVVARQIR